MKFYLSLGGALGFLLAFSGSLLAGNDPVTALRDGAAGCVAGAMLLKFFRHILVAAVQAQVTQPVAAVEASAVSNGSPS